MGSACRFVIKKTNAQNSLVFSAKFAYNSLVFSAKSPTMVTGGFAVGGKGGQNRDVAQHAFIFGEVSGAGRDKGLQSGVQWCPADFIDPFLRDTGYFSYGQRIFVEQSSLCPFFCGKIKGAGSMLVLFFLGIRVLSV